MIKDRFKNAFWGYSHTIGMAIVFLCLSQTARATYDFYGNEQSTVDNAINGQLVTNPGAYDAFVLGEDIIFNACSSTFAGYSLCDLPDTSKFVIQWAAETRNGQGNTQNYQWIGSWNSQANNPGLNVTLTNQGNSSVFGSTGTFYLGLHIVTHSNVYIPLPGGGYAYTGQGAQDPGWIWTGSLSMAETAPEPVPEPTAPLLLLPALAFLARRQYSALRKPSPTIAT